MTPLNAILASLILVASTAFSAERILNLAVAQDGTLADSSPESRQVKLIYADKGDDGTSLRLRSLYSITIPYHEGDPLFKSGPFTWLIKVRFESPLAIKFNIPIAGRWKNSGDQRSAGILFIGGSGKLQFLVSTDGGTDQISAVAGKTEFPERQWFIIVARFLPGKQLSLQLIDSQGNPIDEVFRTTSVADRFFEVVEPFYIGAPEEAGMQFAWLEIWNDALSEDAVKEAILKHTN